MHLNTNVTKYKRIKYKLPEYICDKIQMQQNTKGKNTNRTKYKHDKIQIQQNTNVTTYKCNKIQMEQNTNGTKYK